MSIYLRNKSLEPYYRLVMDYSDDDLQQLLSVSSVGEFLFQMYNLHGICRLNVLEFGDLTQSPKCKDFTSQTLEKIDNHLAILKTFIERLPSDANKSYILPQLFSKLAQTSSLISDFSQNLEQYAKALKLLQDSALTIGHGDEDLTRVVATFYGVCTELVTTARGLSREDNVEQENVLSPIEKEEVTPSIAPVVEGRTEPVLDERIESPEPASAKQSEPPVVVQRTDLSIDTTCDELRKSLNKFVETYQSIEKNKTKVNECLSQLKTFESQGLDVSSAISPLTRQLTQLSELQGKHCVALEARRDALASYVQEFEDDVSAVVKKDR